MPLYYGIKLILQDPIPRFAGFASFMLLCVLLSSGKDENPLVVLALPVAVSALAVHLVGRIVRKQECNYVDRLGAQTSADSLGKLVYSLQVVKGRQPTTRAYRHLVRRLPEMTTWRADALPRENRAILHRLLEESVHYPLVSAIVAVIPSIGDVSSIAPLLACQERVATNPELYAEVLAAKAALQQRLESERLSATLLRPAEAGDSPDALLRPIAGGPNQDQRLVRPVE